MKRTRRRTGDAKQDIMTALLTGHWTDEIQARVAAHLQEPDVADACAGMAMSASRLRATAADLLLVHAQAPEAHRNLLRSALAQPGSTFGSLLHAHMQPGQDDTHMIWRQAMRPIIVAASDERWTGVTMYLVKQYDLAVGLGIAATAQELRSHPGSA